MNDRRHDDEHLERLADDLIGGGGSDSPEADVPVDLMWSRIDSARAPRRRLLVETATGHRARPRSRLSRLQTPVTALVILALGIALGRLSLPGDSEVMATSDTPAPVLSEPAPPATRPTAAGTDDLIYHHASTAVFTRAEALLTSFRASADTTGQERVRRWAALLLTETRLLLDSPAAADAEVGFLLRDLELVLAQIVQLNPALAGDDRQWITRGMNERATLLHLRAALPAGNGVADL